MDERGSAIEWIILGIGMTAAAAFLTGPLAAAGALLGGVAITFASVMAFPTRTDDDEPRPLHTAPPPDWPEQDITPASWLERVEQAARRPGGHRSR